MQVICESGTPKLDCSVKHWLLLDKNPVTRKEVEDYIKNKQYNKLKKCMLGRPKFGTAGLRAKMAAGFKCMNDVVVLQTAQGLCSYLKKECSRTQLQNGIVIGFDGRYNSKRFAELTAKVFVSSSIPALLMSSVCPTPLVSFAVIKYGCAGGVMVTASHNPKEDNGYKVYWGNGSQIITPHDDNILDEIIRHQDIPDEHWDISSIWSHKLVSDCLSETTDAYMAYIKESLSPLVLETNRTASIKTVYSAMHGVGHKFINKAFEAANLQEPISVQEQQEPDPDFSTVKFPNPEEQECLDLSLQLARKRDVKLVLVNDPDADRLAVAEYDDSIGKWKVFSGNEMGALLGWWLLNQYSTGSKTVEPHQVYMIASVVSSKMLRAIAHKQQCQFVETLTGFKWMGNTTLLLAEEGKLPLFAFEEAIGYMCSQRVPDKDGVSAAVQVASLASSLYEKGGSLCAKLQDLYKEYGYHVTYNSYYICNEPMVIQTIFSRIRNYDGVGTYPTKIGRCEIVSVHDLAKGVKIPDSPTDGGHLHVLGTGLDREYSGGEMIMFRTHNGLSITIRTSGTEPKIKYYTEIVDNAHDIQDHERIASELKDMVKEFVEELLEPEKNKLQ